MAVVLWTWISLDAMRVSVAESSIPAATAPFTRSSNSARVSSWTEAGRSDGVRTRSATVEATDAMLLGVVVMLPKTRVTEPTMAA